MVYSANMLLKGEGVAMNATAAVSLYEQAAAKEDLVRAWNGLGYAYYFGSGGLARNDTRALAYFLRAADPDGPSGGRDGDSLFNAGYMLRQGRGRPAGADKDADRREGARPRERTHRSQLASGLERCRHPPYAWWLFLSACCVCNF